MLANSCPRLSAFDQGNLTDGTAVAAQSHTPIQALVPTSPPTPGYFMIVFEFLVVQSFWIAQSVLPRIL